MKVKEDYSIIVTELNEFYFQFEDEDFKKLNISFLKNIKRITVRKDVFILTKDFALFQIEDFYPEESEIMYDLDRIESNLLINEISSSDTHTMLLDLFGNVYVRGENENGELGLKDNGEESLIISEFTKVKLPFKVKQIFADNYNSFIVNENNELFGTGYNRDGQLGLGHNKFVKTFTKIVIKNICQPITYHFHLSHSPSIFMTDSENNIFISGGTDLNDYGIHVKEKYLMELTTIKLKTKYLNILPLGSITLFIGTNYKINNESGESDNILGRKCLTVLQHKKLVDLTFYCDDNNIKKRKRNEFC